MIQYIQQQPAAGNTHSRAFLLADSAELPITGLSELEQAYAKSKFEAKQYSVAFNRLDHWAVVVLVDTTKGPAAAREKARHAGFELCNLLNKEKQEQVHIEAASVAPELLLALAEGVALSNYQFVKYFKEPKENSLRQIFVGQEQEPQAVRELNALITAVYAARNLINEPVLHLTAAQMAHEMEQAALQVGIRAEVLDKVQIESLKMGGLLAVNKGSIDPPTFTILEWKPTTATNSQPIVLVGKGIVFDTGGLSLKPTPASMDMMKADMGGAAAAFGAIYAAAMAQLPLHIVALIPATDNRPGGNAVTPGDVIRMSNGLSVEVLNTDAEGRLILGDALHYAARFAPELIFDIATLTGAAARAIGKEASVVMGTAPDTCFAQLEQAGNASYERVVRFPLWDEYADQIKSDIADIKNIGGPEAGAITAGKFLERFVEGPWIHIDIAGPMWAMGQDSYRGKGPTGVGVRMLFHYLCQRARS